eukprot:1161451-Pelagomonas_calceolata.AAC.5
MMHGSGWNTTHKHTSTRMPQATKLRGARRANTATLLSHAVFNQTFMRVQCAQDTSAIPNKLSLKREMQKRQMSNSACLDAHVQQLLESQKPSHRPEN